MKKWRNIQLPPGKILMTIVSANKEKSLSADRVVGLLRCIVEGCAFYGLTYIELAAL